MGKMLIVATFDCDSKISFARELVLKYKEEFDICVSGKFNKDYEQASSELPCRLAKKNDNTYIQYCFDAEIVILLDATTNFYVRNTKQRVITFVNNNELESKRSAYYLKLRIMTYSTDIVIFEYEEESQLNMCGVKIYRFSESASDIFFEKIISKLEISKSLTRIDKSIIVFAENPTSLNESKFNFMYVPRFLSKSADFYSMLLLHINLDEYESITKHFTGKIAFSNPIAIQYLKTFSGIIACDSDLTLKILNELLQNKGIDPKKICIVKIEKLQLLFGNREINQLVESLGCHKERMSSLYRAQLDEMYNMDETIKRKSVSVIICTYNTPQELLFRAIESVLSGQNDNIELILVDDGSEKRIDSELKQNFSDYGRRLKYFYKENEGLGLSRNFGVTKSTSDYVIFVDSDDIFEINGLLRMLAHAEIFDVEMVVGKIVVADENLKIINESLGQLYGNMYHCYHNNVPSDSFKAQMGAGKLISRKAFEKYDLWFKEGYYEDALFSAKLYRRIPEYHFVNIINYYWIKYSEGNTISSTFSWKHFIDKLTGIKDALDFTFDSMKPERLYFSVQNDLALFLNNYVTFSIDEQHSFFAELQKFILAYKNFYEANRYTPFYRVLIECLLTDDEISFNQLLNEYKDMKQNASDETHDNYFVFTHYNLFHAILMILEQRRPSRIIIYTSYQNFSASLIRRLLDVPFVDDVSTYSIGTTPYDIWFQLESRPEDAASIIPTLLYQKFKPIFTGFDLCDNIYIYNDKYPIWYCLEREFDNLYRLEDAYGSFNRELRFFDMTGKWAKVVEFIPEHYPQMNFQSPKIKGIILTVTPDSIPEHLQDKVEVKDMNQMIEHHAPELENIMNLLYDMEIDSFDAGSVLILTQALALNTLCTKSDQIEMYKAIASKYPKDKVVIKPHPADTVNYDKWGYKMIDKNIPIEALNFSRLRFDTAIAFSSSSVETISIAKNRIRLFGDDFKNKKEITDAIKEIGKKRAKRSVKKSLQRYIKKYIIRGKK